MCVLVGAIPAVQGTLGVKVCVLGAAMPVVRGTLGVKVCVLGGSRAHHLGYSRG